MGSGHNEEYVSAREDLGHATAHLLPEVYEELRSLAAHYLRQERVDHTLQPTALVHEAFLKLSRQSRLDVNDRTHFLAIAAGAMRQVLVDHAPALGRKGGVGRSYADAPEIDGLVRLLPPAKASKTLKVGEFTRARIVAAEGKTGRSPAGP